MTEVVARQVEAEGGSASRLVALYSEASDDAIVEADKLTLEMIAETASWLEMGDQAARGAELVRRWWLNQVNLACGAEEAEEFDQRWSSAFTRAKAKPAEPKAGARPEPKPQAEAEPATRIMLPAVVPPPPPPLQPPKSDWDEAVAAMNKQHAIIENVGNKTVIASWEPSPIDLGRLMVVFQSKESFLLRYSNRFVSIEVPDGRGGINRLTPPLGGWWLGHRDRLQFRGVTFRPGGPKVVHECLNLWQGWGVEAKPGDWGLIREHVEQVLAGSNEEFAEYIIRWIAWSIQNPAAPAEVALVLIGEKGAGKGTLVRCLQRIFGAHAFQVTSREEVIGKFNGHLQDCVLFVAD
jgi:ABC-type multidrug transport system fused ATPase/permease subunit